jgi:CRISPR-associated endonuclease/helicase Cas3
VLLQPFLGAAVLSLHGHHGGLRSPTEFRNWLAPRREDPDVIEAIAWAKSAIPDLLPDHQIAFPPFADGDALGAELFIRMAFSALVDADFLDTERHFDADKSASRGGAPSLAELWELFQRNQAALPKADDALGRLRTELYDSCLAAASQPVGLKALSAITGSGKTRSSMAFALPHALTHGLDRVIVAVPFISITTQTASIYREIFGASAVLEHHSQVQFEDSEEADCYARSRWARLAAENWDAPVVVTTVVQLFESLFGHKPSSSRKVHRLTRSVVILDEVQSLPPHLLEPILSALRELSENYGTTVVLSTATQPTFSVVPGFKELHATEIAHTSVTLPPRFDTEDLGRVPWTTVAERMRECPQVLAVVNTKRDALALLDALDDSEAFHLSTNLCGLHRRDVIAGVRERLDADASCKLISTQVIEAGVDISFPVGFRAYGPLDSIVQVGGRVNREAKLTKGRLIIFEPEDGGLPKGSYKTATQETRALLTDGQYDRVDDPALLTTYYQRVYSIIPTDREHIQPLRKSFDFPQVAQRFVMIDEDTEQVIVHYGTAHQQRRVQQLIEELRAGTPRGRYIVRELQSYIVSIRRTDADKWRASGLIADIVDGIGEWTGAYCSVRGLIGD